MISVCMATYNGEKFIKEQIDSILPQLSDDDELVVSDDGSKDRTLDIISSYNDKRIRILHHGAPHGFVHNFENALDDAKGDYIFLSDQDDTWKPNKVQVVMDYLKKYQLVIHNADLIDGTGKSLGKTYYDTLHNKTGFWANFYKTRWLGCCMAFRREVKDYCLPFPKGIVGHDYWIGMLGMLKFRYYFIDEVLMNYRRHGGNLSPSGEKSNHSWLYKLYTKRFVILLAIIKRLCK